MTNGGIIMETVCRYNKTEWGDWGDVKHKVYFETSRIHSGIATLSAGGKGDLDIGHKEGEEVITICKGKLIVHLPSSGKEVELSKGDAILIPVGEPHQVINRGKEEALFVFNVAPRI